jgi:hypothetical protein
MRYARSMREQRGLMSATVRSCASCGTGLPAGARFCASCGARTGPPERPVSWSIAEKRLFGVVPGATAMSALQGRLGRWLAVLRARTRYAATVVEARVAAVIARVRLQWDLRNLAHERAGRLHALGDAVYRDDRVATGRIRSQVADVERRMEALNMELQQVDRTEQERIARARMEGDATNVVVPEPQPEPSEPPGPVIVPEPEPEPHVPPGPVIVPEPGPPDPNP